MKNLDVYLSFVTKLWDETREGGRKRGREGEGERVREKGERERKERRGERGR